MQDELLSRSTCDTCLQYAIQFKDKVKDTDRAALVDENDHRSGAHVAEFATKRLHSAEDAVFGKRATKCVRLCKALT